jgi:integrase
LLPLIREPFRTMVLVAGCLGLRVSEIVALRWQDFDFPRLILLVQRSIVHGRVGDVKTEYSRDSVPLDLALVEVLMQHQGRCIPTPEGWLFANPVTGRPYHQEEIQKTHIRKAGLAAGIRADIGWHTFRHSYRSWLDDTGAPLTVQKVDAPCQHTNHNEHLRQGHDGQQTSSAQQGRGDGLQQEANQQNCRPQEAGCCY